MKKTTKLLALLLVAVLLTMTLASCGGISGKYSAELLGTGVELEFKGSKVNARFKVLGSYGDPIEGKYKIKKADDKMEITFTFEDENDDTKAYGGTQSFSIDKENDTIKIGLVTYKKAE